MQLRKHSYTPLNPQRLSTHRSAEGIKAVSGLSFLLTLLINALATLLGQVKALTSIVQTLLNSITSKCPTASTTGLNSVLTNLGSLSSALGGTN
jgi:hypothetical protein